MNKLVRCTVFSTMKKNTPISNLYTNICSFYKNFSWRLYPSSNSMPSYIYIWIWNTIWHKLKIPYIRIISVCKFTATIGAKSLEHTVLTRNKHCGKQSSHFSGTFTPVFTPLQHVSFFSLDLSWLEKYINLECISEEWC